jgi:hypothetical protein
MGRQVLAIGRHIPAPLQDLPNQLILGQAGGDARQIGTPLPALAV